MVLVSLPLSLDVSVSFFEEGGTALSEITGKVKHRAAHLSEETSTWTRSAQGMRTLCKLFTAIFREAFNFCGQQHEFCTLHLLRRVIFEPYSFV